jgi:hypothetical protein
MSNEKNTLPTDTITYNITSAKIAELHTWRASLYEKAAAVWDSCAKNEIWLARAAANNAKLMQQQAAQTGMPPSGPAPTTAAIALASLKKAEEQRAGAKYERELAAAVTPDRTYQLSATSYLEMIMDPSAQMMPPDLEEAPGAPSGSLNIPKN